MTDNNGSFIMAPENNSDKLQSMTPWGKEQVAKKNAEKTQNNQASYKLQKAGENNKDSNVELYVMAPKDNPINSWGKRAVDAVVEKREQISAWLTRGFGNSKETAGNNQAQTENSPHDKMVKMINYMNKINGNGKALDAEAVSKQLTEKYGDKALALLTIAVNEPKNYAKYSGENVRLSRKAVQSLCDAKNPEELADNVLNRRVPPTKTRMKQASHNYKTEKTQPAPKKEAVNDVKDEMKAQSLEAFRDIKTIGLENTGNDNQITGKLDINVPNVEQKEETKQKVEDARQRVYGKSKMTYETEEGSIKEKIKINKKGVKTTNVTYRDEDGKKEAQGKQTEYPDGTKQTVLTMDLDNDGKKDKIYTTEGADGSTLQYTKYGNGKSDLAKRDADGKVIAKQTSDELSQNPEVGSDRAAGRRLKERYDQLSFIKMRDGGRS